MAFVKGSRGRLSLCLFIAEAVTLLIMTQTSTSKGLIQDQYFGCFNDSGAANEGPSLVGARTTENCVAVCNTTYAAIKVPDSTLMKETDNSCRCLEDYGTQLPDSSCFLTCSGNSYESCGAQLNAYALYTVCPIGTFGSACDKGCHCKREVPCNRTNGNCPGGCEGDWSGPSCNITTVSRQYIGCYSDDDNNRALENCVYCDKNSNINNTNNTLESCSQSCAERNYSYAGPQFFFQCWCGENYNKHGPVNESICNTNCTGNKSEICGGVNALSVYSVCPNGTYGRSCARRCHCFNNTGCIYRNGSCPSTRCKPGWTGSSCNIRDCKVANGDCNSDENCSNITLLSSIISVCRCPPGFRRNNIGGICADIDECSDKVDLCDPVSTMCNNTVGNYNCTCNMGFESSNVTACADIDECQNGTYDCDQSSTFCSNSPGSHSCMCKKGFTPFTSTICTVTVDNKGIIAGAVVGSVLGAALIAAVVVLLIYLSRRRKYQKGESSQNNKTVSSQTIQNSVAETEIYNQRHEPYYNNYSAPTIRELPNVLRYKLTTQGVLDKEFKQVPMDSKDPSTVGKSREVKKKNRFRNIVSYDKNRVVLSKVNDVAFSDYINASLIQGYKEDDKVIAAQGPLPDTIHDFWRMICEQDVCNIVMITDLMENNKIKCEKYWPDNGKSIKHKDITVRTTTEQARNGYVRRHFQVTNDSETLSVTHWHFLSFPDHGVPEEVSKFMAFLKKVRISKLPEKATVVHCSAGVGRTGTFIAIDYLLQQGKAENQVDILGCLRHLRNQRPQMIQNPLQYKFVHQALLFEYTVGDTAIPCEMFATKFQELQKKNPTTGMNKLETELQTIEEGNDNASKEKKHRVASKSVDKNRIAEMDVTFLQGWEQKDAYMSLALPQSTAVSDLYSLTREFNCRVIIFLDGEPGTMDSIFPTNDKPLELNLSTVLCDNSSDEVFGTCHKISDTRLSGDTYANVTLYENIGAASGKFEMTALHVTESVNSESLGYNALDSLYTTLRRLNAARTESPSVVISSSGNSVTAFFLAGLIAFDMIRIDKEVDIFQIVKDIRKCGLQFSFSLASYTELYAVVGQFIQTASHHTDGTTSPEILYERVQ